MSAQPLMNKLVSPSGYSSCFTVSTWQSREHMAITELIKLRLLRKKYGFEKVESDSDVLFEYLQIVGKLL